MSLVLDQKSISSNLECSHENLLLLVLDLAAEARVAGE
jgi:hypothetical protein